MKKNVLILSTGRTGTLAICHLLKEQLEGYTIFHESPYSRLFNILGNASLRFNWATHILFFFWKRLNKHNKCCVIDSNNLLYSLPKLLPDEFKNYKIIHIYRHPESYVNSHERWAQTRLKSLIANYIIPFWQPSGYLLGNISYIRWFCKTLSDKFYWIWEFKNKHISNYQNSHDYFCASFESIFAESNELVIGRLLEFIKEERVEKNKPYIINKKNSSLEKSRHFKKTSPKMLTTCLETLKSLDALAEKSLQNNIPNIKKTIQ